MKSFFSKKIVVGALVTATVCVSGITDAKAQEFAVQGDIVSSYVWRGMYQGGGKFHPDILDEILRHLPAVHVDHLLKGKLPFQRRGLRLR